MLEQVLRKKEDQDQLRRSKQRNKERHITHHKELLSFNGVLHQLDNFVLLHPLIELHKFTSLFKGADSDILLSRLTRRDLFRVIFNDYHFWPQCWQCLS